MLVVIVLIVIVMVTVVVYCKCITGGGGCINLILVKKNISAIFALTVFIYLDTFTTTKQSLIQRKKPSHIQYQMYNVLWYVF